MAAAKPTVFETDEAVIAALRLAVEATDNWERLGKVVNELLKYAPATPAGNIEGIEVLLRAHGDGVLTFSVGT